MLAKLAAVDGAGSGLDADLLDGASAGSFLADTEAAGGDLEGPFSNLQVADGALRMGDLTSGGEGRTSGARTISAGACELIVNDDLIDDSPGSVMVPRDAGTTGSATPPLPLGIWMPMVVADAEGDHPLLVCNANETDTVLTGFRVDTLRIDP